MAGALVAAEPAQDQTSPQTTSQQTASPAQQPAGAPQQPGATTHKEVVPAVPKPRAGSTPATPAADKDKSKDAAQGTEGTGKDAAQAATKDTAGDKPADEDADPVPKKGAATAADKAGSPQRFVPSEQVRADFDVSFPIDI
jgi:hypothetical protein